MIDAGGEQVNPAPLGHPTLISGRMVGRRNLPAETMEHETNDHDVAVIGAGGILRHTP